MTRSRKNDLTNLPTGAKVTMHNTLISASHGLNLSEKRLVSMAVSKLSPTAAALPGKPIKILAVDFAEQFGLEAHTAYVQLREAQETLFNRYIRHIEHYGLNGQKVEVVKVRWISSIRYKDGEGEVSIAFAPEIAQFLVQLKKHFTSYQLSKAAAFDRPILGDCSRTSNASGIPAFGRWTSIASTSSWKPRRATAPTSLKPVAG